MDRRAFLTDSLGAAASVSLPAHLRPLTPPGRSGSVGTPHLLELREGLRALFQLDDAYGGAAVRSLAFRHLRRIQRVIDTGTYPDTIGRQLKLLAGEMIGWCGWLHYDADEQKTARRYWGEALTAAATLGDANLEILVFSQMSLQASFQGRPQDGLDLARAGQERATRLGSPVLQSIMACRETRALSVMADGKTAGRRLTDAMRLLDHKGRGRPFPEWTAFHGPAEVEYCQGLLYNELGNYQAAVPFLRAALTHQEITYGRNRALYRLMLANTLVKADEAEEGAAYAVETLEQLDEVESGRVLRQLAEVAHALRPVDTASARNAVEQLDEYARLKSAA
ncbi:hypothetical protein ABZ348_06650 [Streptomyces sp. NPDC005963]|uniref:hypothetical protein n=1 Tax=Streptomyces sp. NPDC005963 TaxID=3156721 RepID=UPI0033F972FF